MWLQTIHLIASKHVRSLGTLESPTSGSMASSKSLSSSGATSPTVIQTPSAEDGLDAVSVVESDIDDLPLKPRTEFEAIEDQSRVGVFKHLLKKPHIRAVLGSAFMLSLLAVGFDVVFVLYSYTSIELGGMARSVSRDFHSTPSLGVGSI